MRQYLLTFALQQRTFRKSRKYVGIGVGLTVLTSRQLPSQRIGL
jgi:hypothetical protein